MRRAYEETTRAASAPGRWGAPTELPAVDLSQLGDGDLSPVWIRAKLTGQGATRRFLAGESSGFTWWRRDADLGRGRDRRVGERRGGPPGD